MSERADKQVGFFILPAEHLDELHALEAAIEEARRREEEDPEQLEWIFYRRNQLFERAKQISTASTVIPLSDGWASVLLWSWLVNHFRAGDERYVLNPDEFAAIARELPGVRAEDMLRWVRRHPGYRKTEPLLIEVFEDLVRTVAAAPAEPAGFAMLMFYEQYRHPPEPPPPKPEPEPEPPDVDEGAIMGWFAVPAERLAALHDIAAERDAAFRQGRMPDFYALETRLFEEAKAAARGSAVFNAWNYRKANRLWWRAMPRFRSSMPPTVLEPKEREHWAYWLSRQELRYVRERVCQGRADITEEDLDKVGELFETLRRMITSERDEGCGLVIAWWFAKPPTWARYEDASLRATRVRVHELKGYMDEAEARLHAIAARQRRARAKVRDAARGGGREDRGQAQANTTTGAPAPEQGERAAIDRARDELTSRFPWLRRLQNSEAILAAYARAIVARTAGDADHAGDATGALPARMPIALTELFTDDFFDGDTGVERAGRRAMAEEIARHPAWVELVLPRRRKPDVRVYIDGKRLRLQDGGLHADAFFARGGGALLDVQAAWHRAVNEASERELVALYKMHPSVAGELMEDRFREMTSQSVLKRLDREERQERRQRSKD